MSPMMFALSLGFGGVNLATQIAFATPQCARHAQVADGLAQDFGETRQNLGTAAASTQHCGDGCCWLSGRQAPEP